MRSEARVLFQPPEPPEPPLAPPAPAALAPPAAAPPAAAPPAAAPPAAAPPAAAPPAAAPPLPGSGVPEPPALSRARMFDTQKLYGTAASLLVTTAHEILIRADCAVSAV